MSGNIGELRDEVERALASIRFMPPAAGTDAPHAD